MISKKKKEKRKKKKKKKKEKKEEKKEEEKKKRKITCPVKSTSIAQLIATTLGFILIMDGSLTNSVEQSWTSGLSSTKLKSLFDPIKNDPIICPARSLLYLLVITPN